DDLRGVPPLCTPARPPHFRPALVRRCIECGAGGSAKREEPCRARDGGRVSGACSGVHRFGEPRGTVLVLPGAQCRRARNCLVPIMANPELAWILVHVRHRVLVGRRVLSATSVPDDGTIPDCLLPFLRSGRRSVRTSATGGTARLH